MSVHLSSGTVKSFLMNAMNTQPLGEHKHRHAFWESESIWLEPPKPCGVLVFGLVERWGPYEATWIATLSNCARGRIRPLQCKHPPQSIGEVLIVMEIRFARARSRGVLSGSWYDAIVRLSDLLTS